MRLKSTILDRPLAPPCLHTWKTLAGEGSFADLWTREAELPHNDSHSACHIISTHTYSLPAPKRRDRACITGRKRQRKEASEDKEKTGHLGPVPSPAVDHVPRPIPVDSSEVVRTSSPTMAYSGQGKMTHVRHDSKL